MIIALPSPQVIQIAGADALAFCQAQFSSDVTLLENGRWGWSAWLSASGRIRALFHLLRCGDEQLLLIMRGGDAAKLRDALQRYVFRAKVQLRVIDDASACVANTPADLPAGMTPPSRDAIGSAPGVLCLALPGAAPRWLLLASSTAAPMTVTEAETARNDNALADIDAGIARVDEALEDTLLPHWLGLPELGAVSVGKGCYPGQEIVARLHFKGGNKRWLHRIEFLSDALPAPGMALDGRNDGSAHGLVVSAAWMSPGRGAALAVLSEAASEAALGTGDAGIRVVECRRVTYPAMLDRSAVESV